MATAIRLALLGAARDEAAGRAWRAAVESAGAVPVPSTAWTAVAGPPAGLRGCDAVLVAGPVAGGDDAAVGAFARAGGPVLAIGAGVGVLCALGLLPGQLTDDGPAGTGPGPASPPASYVRVEGRPTPFTSAIPAGRVLRLPAAPAPRQRWQLPDAALWHARGQVIFRACDAAGGTRSTDQFAGLSNEQGNVVGLLAAEEIVAGEGAQLLRSLRLHLHNPR